MKMLLDQGLPRSAALLLREAGYDAVHTAEIALATATDTDILLAALQQGRVIVTLDADFHALLARSGASAPSVIRIRIERLRGEDVLQLVLSVLAVCASDLETGAVVTVQPNRIRLRRLPLIS